jgi:hypothetical protein
LTRFSRQASADFCILPSQTSIEENRMSKREMSLHAVGALLLAVTAMAGMGAARAAGEAGTVKISKGNVAILRAGQTLPAITGSPVMVSDRVTTGSDGSVGITLRDNTLLSAGPHSTLELNKFSFDSTTHQGEINATVKRGTLAVISGKVAAAAPTRVSFNTPTATLGVRGTEFVIEVADRERLQ